MNKINLLLPGEWAKLLLNVLSVLYLALFAIMQAEAASVPVGFTDKQVAGGLTSPSAMTVMPDGRVLVAQQNGVIKMIKADTLLGADFYTVPNVDSFAERGCLGITTDPNFASNGFVYLYCTITDGINSHNRILRVTEAGDVAVGGSERTILDLPDIPAGTRFFMGGALRFGADGKLYVAVGKHADPVSSTNSQDITNPFGKVLRINPDGTVPSDNPFFNTPGAYQANFSIGLRNPFSIDVQPGTGLMYISDVGESSWEEINKGIAGANYGWPIAEGNSSDSRFTNPVYTYSHSMGCAITGGTFYNPQTAQFPASYVGKYLFADFCNGWIKVLDPGNPVTPDDFVAGIENPISLSIGPDGSLYYLARNQGTGTPTIGVGTVGKINFTNTQVPRITTNPQSQIVLLGSPATFTVSADGATSYQWQRNGVNIAGATAASYTIPNTVAADNQARFAAIASNSFGSAASATAILTVTTNRPPVATIDTPAAGSVFGTGEKITYSGSGTDPEDGTLPASAFTWQVDFQHDTHSHPFLAAASGAKNGSFTVQDFESDASNTWLRIYLTVKDAGGQTNTAVRDIYPRTQVSAMTPAGTPVSGWGPMERDMSNGETAAGDGRTITLRGIPYAKGLGVHAASDVRYNLGAACSGYFVSDVGVDDEVGGQGSVVFQVFLDGVKAYDSGIVSGTDPRKSVNLSVAGKNELQLVVTDGGDGNSADHADWAGARVTGCGTATIATTKQVSDMTPVGTPVNGWGPMEKDMSNGEMAAGDGRTITLRGTPYAKGLGVHAASDVRYNLGAACSGSFVSDVGVDDEVDGQGSVVFQVFLDGVKAYDSGIVSGTDPRKSANLSVAGKNELRLVVTDGGDGKSADHADWANAQVTNCK